MSHCFSLFPLSMSLHLPSSPLLLRFPLFLLHLALRPFLSFRRPVAFSPHSAGNGLFLFLSTHCCCFTCPDRLAPSLFLFSLFSRSFLSCIPVLFFLLVTHFLHTYLVLCLSVSRSPSVSVHCWSQRYPFFVLFLFLFSSSSSSSASRFSLHQTR